MSEETKYTRYDFDRPDKFSFDHLRSLESIFTVFSRNFATDLSGYIRMPAEVVVKNIEQIPFNTDYLEKRERDKYVFCISEFDGEQFLIQFEVGFILRVLSKVLGGEFGTIEKVSKNITKYEKMLVQEILENQIYPKMQSAFRAVKEITITNNGINDIESDPQYARVTVPQDMVALITLTVKIKNQITEIQVILPYLSMETIIERLSSDNILANKKSETPEKQLSNLYDHLLQINRDFIVNLGKTSITLSELMALEEGDIIVLDEFDKPVGCSVDNIEKFKGKIGIKNNKYAVQITNVKKHITTEEEQQNKIEKIKTFLEYKKEEEV